MKIASSDRILLLAPHPDDESLAAGGLIQRAVSLGAAVRILFATDGDDNPWPQRFVERRLKIKTSDRLRWGRRRREEALAAMARLGLPKSAAAFFALPDQGVTELLLGADETVLRGFCREIERWRPTLFVVPSGEDTHPDHSGLFVFAQLALARVENPPRSLRYLVHFPRKHSHHRGMTIKLRPSEIEVKREAILCHGTQMALSRKRFVSYAKTSEIFYSADAPREADSHHPVVGGQIHRGALQLQLRLPRPRATFSGLMLFVAFESLVAGSVRWSMTLPANSRKLSIQNIVTGERVRTAAIRIRGRGAKIVLPISAFQPLCQIFVKLQRRTLFFDDSGWREIPARPAFAAQSAEIPPALPPQSKAAPTDSPYSPEAQKAHKNPSALSS